MYEWCSVVCATALSNAANMAQCCFDHIKGHIHLFGNLEVRHLHAIVEVDKTHPATSADSSFIVGAQSGKRAKENLLNFFII